MKSFLREIVITLVMAIVIFFGLQMVIDSRIIPSSSMEPTLVIGQRLIISKVSYYLHEPERGDIIIFHHPYRDEDATPFIKRIIALPGETVAVTGGKVYVDGQELDEPYIMAQPRYTLPAQKIPQGQYFVLGDNRNISSDSHTGWTVPRGNIIGKTWLSIWPPDKWGLAPNHCFTAPDTDPVNTGLSRLLIEPLF